MKRYTFSQTRPGVLMLAPLLFLLAAAPVFADNFNGNGARLLLSGADAWAGVSTGNSSGAGLIASGTADQGGWHTNSGDALLRINPLVPAAAEGEGEGIREFHTADQNGDNVISLSELLRVIQFFNSDGYHCQAGTEDGYAPGPGDQTCAPHASDYYPQDWRVNLSELLRVIQFFNSGGYYVCPDDGTEDGFCPGPSPS